MQGNGTASLTTFTTIRLRDRGLRWHGRVDQVQVGGSPDQRLVLSAEALGRRTVQGSRSRGSADGARQRRGGGGVSSLGERLIGSILVAGGGGHRPGDRRGLGPGHGAASQGDAQAGR